MANEHWHWIVGYEGLYEVSDNGNVRSYQQRKVGLKIRPYLIGCSVEKPSGRITVSLWKNGKESRRKVHHLVLETFVGPCPEGLEGCHNNGNTQDNHLSNLRWDTHKSNCADRKKHGTERSCFKKGLRMHTKLTILQVKAIRAIGRSKTEREIAEMFPVGPTQISNILLGYSWQGV